MRCIKSVLASFLLFVSMSSFAQTKQTNSIRTANYRTEIGLDLTVPDFETKSIDATVMGTRLAGLLDYLLENYKQLIYNRKFCKILKEQNQALKKIEFEIIKIQFDGTKKVGKEIALTYTVWLGKNIAKVKQTELAFHFKDGVSESQAANELFSMMSRYVQQREQLQKQ